MFASIVSTTLVVKFASDQIMRKMIRCLPDIRESIKMIFELKSSMHSAHNSITKFVVGQTLAILMQLRDN
jgi:hypothetical protein